MAKSKVRPFMVTTERAVDIVVHCLRRRPTRFTYPNAWLRSCGCPTWFSARGCGLGLPPGAARRRHRPDLEDATCRQARGPRQNHSGTATPAGHDSISGTDVCGDAAAGSRGQSRPGARRQRAADFSSNRRRTFEVHRGNLGDLRVVELHHGPVLRVLLVAAQRRNRLKLHDQDQVPATRIMQLVATYLETLDAVEHRRQSQHSRAERLDVLRGRRLSIFDQYVVLKHRPGCGQSPRRGTLSDASGWKQESAFRRSTRAPAGMVGGAAFSASIPKPAAVL